MKVDEKILNFPSRHRVNIIGLVKFLCNWYLFSNATFFVIGFWQSSYFFPQFNTLQPKCKGVNMLTRVIFWRSMRKFSIFRLVIESTLLAGLIFDWTDWSQIRLSRVSNPHRVGRASIHGLPNVFSGMKSKLFIAWKVECTVFMYYRLFILMYCSVNLQKYIWQSLKLLVYLLAIILHYQKCLKFLIEGHQI